MSNLPKGKAGINKKYRYPEGEMTQREWVERYADRVEQVMLKPAYNRKHANGLEGEAYDEYQRRMNISSPHYRAWRGDVYQDITQDTYQWASTLSRFSRRDENPLAGSPDYAPVLIVGGIVAVGLLAFLAMPASTRPAQAKTVSKLPPSQAPKPPAAPGTIAVTGGNLAPLLPLTAQADYVYPLWTARWNGSEWGDWDNPAPFRGHLIQAATLISPPMWSSPEDDVNAYLDGLTETNQAPGFFLTYKLAVNPDGSYGKAAGWISGRFGDVAVSTYNPFTGALSQGGVGTHFWALPEDDSP